ncbi:hypothetical protein NDU88_001480 [Pleurodeles waltl]|uniref:Tyr recombinase domain-containing protein n=1 Tax=Pleurodeles waltl TaxID=8319 RepID=A0AAV7MMT6_PLEWA|nr:hypothetical protein NDU88_001480 [Pleurodeles waltl]
MFEGGLGGKVDASIQVSPVKVDGKSQVSVGDGDGSSTKLESGDGAKSGAGWVKLLASQFLADLRLAIKRVGLEPSSYGTHSFRIGAAMEARRQAELFLYWSLNYRKQNGKYDSKDREAAVKVWELPASFGMAGKQSYNVKK